MRTYNTCLESSSLATHKNLWLLYVLVLCGHVLADCYVVLLRKRYEAPQDLSLIVGCFGQFTNFSSNQFVNVFS